MTNDNQMGMEIDKSQENHGESLPPLTPGAIPRYELNPAGQFFARLLLKDSLYPFSALLMMIGCYLFLKTGYTNGTSTPVVLGGFLILQGFELLVLGLACVLARRLGRLSDCMMLLFIQLMLLMDPTLFTNAFYSLQNRTGLIVNLLTFLLVPVKLWVLQYFLRFRLSKTGYVYIMASVGLIYIGLYPMSLYDPGMSKADLYFLLMWIYAGLACFIPAARGIARMIDRDPAYSCRADRKILKRSFTAIPLIVAGIQMVTTLWICGVDYDPVFFAPYFVVATMIAVSFAHPRRTRKLSLLADAATVSGIFFAMWSLMLWGDSSEAPAFRECLFSFILSLCGFCALYLSLFLRWRSYDQLLRAGFLALLLVLTYGANLGWFEGVGWLYNLGYEFYIARWHDLIWFFQTYTGFLKFCLWAAGLWVVYKIKSPRGWAIYAGLTLIGAFHALHATLHLNAADALHFIFLYAIILHHFFGSSEKKADRSTLAFMTMLFSVIAALINPAWWREGLLLMEFTAFLVGGLLYAQVGYWVMAGIQMGTNLLGLIILTHASLAATMIAYALIIFTLGALISFNRLKVIELLHQAFPGAVIPPPIPQQLRKPQV